MQERVAVERGGFGEWIGSALKRQSYAKLSRSDLWKAWADYNGVDPSMETIDGAKESGLGKLIRRSHGVDISSVWTAGKKVRGWNGLYLGEAQAPEDAPMSQCLRCHQGHYPVADLAQPWRSAYCGSCIEDGEPSSIPRELPDGKRGGNT